MDLRLNNLSIKALEWLQEAVDQLHDGDGIIVDKEARQECVEAGLVTLKPFGRMEFDLEKIELFLK